MGTLSRRGRQEYTESWTDSKGRLVHQCGPHFTDVEKVMNPTLSMQKQASVLFKEGKEVEARTLLQRAGNLWMAIYFMERGSEETGVLCFSHQSMLQSKYITALLSRTPEEIVHKIDKGNLGHEFLMYWDLAEWASGKSREETSRINSDLQRMNRKGPGYYSPIGDAEQVAKWRKEHEEWLAAVEKVYDEVVAKVIATPAKPFTKVQKREDKDNIDTTRVFRASQYGSMGLI